MSRRAAGESRERWPTKWRWWAGARDDSCVSGISNSRAGPTLRLSGGLKVAIVLFTAMAIVGAAMSVSLSIADHVVAQNWRAAIINGCVGLALGLLGGALNLCIAGLLYSSLGGGDEGTSVVMQVFARS